jgi:hypothetical protein
LDILHSVLFYAFAAVAVAGGLATSFLGARARALGVGAVAIGLAGLYADLNAGFAALVTLVAVGASALLLLGLQVPRGAAADPVAGGFLGQLGGVLAGAVFVVLAYIAFRGRYFGGAANTGLFNAAALGRVLFGRDALAVDALAASLLLALILGGLAARTRTR